jgi:predicted NBD/HSP70 family sugar kinase
MKAYQVDTTINAKLQNIINRSVVFYYLRRNPNAYRAQISKALNISAPAVSRVISRLIAEGYVIETERSVTASGKKATRLLVNPDIGIVIGIDLIKERIRIALSDFMGNIIQSFDGSRIDEKVDVVKEVCRDIDRILAVEKPAGRMKSRLRRLKAISIGIPAVFYSNSGEMGLALYKNLENVDLKLPLSKRYKVPVFVENVTRLSALAEKHYGIAKEYRDIVFVEISNGIGAGIILDGHIFRGSIGSAGEIGFSRVGAESLGFKVENKGFLEKVASVQGMREAALQAIRQGRKTKIRDMVNRKREDVSAAAICNAANEGDPLARQIIQSIVNYLSLVFINMILVLNPELLVIGGEITILPGIEKLILEPIRRIVEQFVPFKAPQIALSSLGDDAGVIGASHLAIDSLLMKDFPYKIADLSADN